MQTSQPLPKGVSSDQMQYWRLVAFWLFLAAAVTAVVSLLPKP